jgi:putative tryptophan/tyrosine transport system substrate-binding protein
MKRRSLVWTLAGAPLCSPLAARAQQPPRVLRLGYLHPGTRSPTPPFNPLSLVSNLRELGFTEGRDFVIEARFAGEKPEQLPALALELVQLKCDVIVAVAHLSIMAAKAATSTIPIVFLNNDDPVKLGHVASLARPGANVTGILIAPQGTLGEKRLALLKEMVPRATRVAMLAPEGASATSTQGQEVRHAAERLGVELVVVEVVGGDYAKAFTTMAAARATAVFVSASPRFLRDRQLIIEQAALHRLPAIYEWPRYVKDGGLMSYGANEADTYRRVAVYVDRIFKGATPKDLPVELPSKLMLVVNLKTAKALGLKIPQAMRLRIDEVVE